MQLCFSRKHTPLFRKELPLLQKVIWMSNFWGYFTNILCTPVRVATYGWADGRRDGQTDSCHGIIAPAVYIALDRHPQDTQIRVSPAVRRPVGYCYFVEEQDPRNTHSLAPALQVFILIPVWGILFNVFPVNDSRWCAVRTPSRPLYMSIYHCIFRLSRSVSRLVRRSVTGAHLSFRFALAFTIYMVIGNITSSYCKSLDVLRALWFSNIAMPNMWFAFSKGVYGTIIGNIVGRCSSAFYIPDSFLFLPAHETILRVILGCFCAFIRLDCSVFGVGAGSEWRSIPNRCAEHVQVQCHTTEFTMLEWAW
jgi:hypothetical protein